MQHLHRPVFIIILTGFIVFSSFAQIGGRATYGFLDRTNSARVAALGGNILAIHDNDIGLVLTNPSLITAEMNNTLAMDYVLLPSAYNYGDIMYSRSFKKVGSFVGTFQFINYGKFTMADAGQNITGEFTAGEYALTVGWGRKLNPHFSIGANGKLIYSQLESYHSFGMAVDVAGSYTTTDDIFSASLLARNIGLPIVNYIPGQTEPLPFTMQAALAARLKHIPVRFSFLYNNIEKWDLTYNADTVTTTDQLGQSTSTTSSKSGLGGFADQLMRHIVVGTEVTIAKAFSIRLGYNYRVRQEMKLNDRTGFSGFTYGFGLRIKMFSISYARSTYMAGKYNPNYFSFAINIGQLSKKKEPKVEGK
ncbi:MAG: type IX secretion system protein PorQ [Bacteroidetes bacterium]|nr:type IX secretion system protein PorQ [Bacteroidota bacterium]